MCGKRITTEIKERDANSRRPAEIKTIPAIQTRLPHNRQIITSEGLTTDSQPTKEVQPCRVQLCLRREASEPIPKEREEVGLHNKLAIIRQVLEADTKPKIPTNTTQVISQHISTSLLQDMRLHRTFAEQINLTPFISV